MKQKEKCISGITLIHSERVIITLSSSEEENDKYKEVRSLKLKEIKKTQTQFNLNASVPDEEDLIGELKFSSNGASAFKACIEKTFSSKHKYLLFHFNTEKSHLMISNLMISNHLFSIFFSK